MAITRSDVALLGASFLPRPTRLGEVFGHRGAVTVTTGAANGDVFELCGLPGGCRIVDLYFDFDNIEAGGDLVLDFGFLDGAYGLDDEGRACGDEFIAATAALQGDVDGLLRSTLIAVARVTPTAADRGIGFTVGTLAETAAEGIVGGTILYTIGAV